MVIELFWYFFSFIIIYDTVYSNCNRGNRLWSLWFVCEILKINKNNIQTLNNNIKYS